LTTTNPIIDYETRNDAKYIIDIPIVYGAGFTSSSFEGLKSSEDC